MAVTLASPSLCILRRSTRGLGGLCVRLLTKDGLKRTAGNWVELCTSPLNHGFCLINGVSPMSLSVKVGCAWKTPPSHLRGALETWAMIYYWAAWPAPASQKFPFHFAHEKP